MILIFGGTTEGRIAAEVCEESGKRFYYSTKSNSQKVELHNGVRLCGSMSAGDIKDFCRSNGISCIIDAAHPFAENLHREIGLTGMEVIRLQRTFSRHSPGAVYCDDFADAMKKMEAAGCRCLLALCGVNTISRLKPYWTRHTVFFRILDRKDSIEKALGQGFPRERTLFYNESLELPSAAAERSVMESIGCDAILTKESGTTGGTDAKLRAAEELGLKIFVVKHPELPSSWEYATGRYSLRRCIEKIVPGFFPLKTGLTTGACATAATKAALLSYLFDDDSEEVCFCLPDGETVSVAVEHNAKGVASVVKDFSDDPDVTRGCKVTATVSLSSPSDRCRGQRIRFLQGKGVGRVTLPGLGIPVGEPAVNPTPREMISRVIRDFTDQDADVTISVEGGEELARRTFNGRVGVVGGISILGSSGIVHPYSNDAFIRSLRRELQVAWAVGAREIGLVAGMRSERMLRKEKDIRCVHYGNFIGEALKAAHETGFRKADVAIMIGKAVKLAAGNLDTHSHKVAMDKLFLSRIAAELGVDPKPIEGITMARELWDVMPGAFFNRIASLCLDTCMSVFPEGEIKIYLICDKQQN